MTKSTRADSVKGKTQALNDALKGPIEVPAHLTLREGDIVYWNDIVCARARNTWTAPDLAKAANLARCQADIERISRELDAEGDIIENKRGTPIKNPKHDLLETLTRRELALSRALHVHAEATVGKSEDAAKKLEAERQAREATKVAHQQGGDSLIPGLSTLQ